MTPPLSLCVAVQFSRTPGSRYITEGDFSGEQFRQTVLLPMVRAALEAKTKLLVDLDGTAGFGTSFLEEAFGGLVRDDGIPAAELARTLDFQSTEEPYLVEDIRTYIEDAAEAKRKSGG